MGSRGDPADHLTSEGRTDPDRPRRFRQKAVIVSAAVTDPEAAPVERDGRDENHVDLFNRDGMDLLSFRFAYPVMAGFQFRESRKQTGPQPLLVGTAAGNDDSFSFSPSPAEDSIGLDLAPEAQINHQRG